MEAKINYYAPMNIIDSDVFMKIIKACNDSYIAGKYVGDEPFLGVCCEESTHPVFMNRRVYTDVTRAQYDENYKAEHDDFTELMWVVSKEGCKSAFNNKLNSGAMLYKCACFCMVTNAKNCDDLITTFNDFEVPGLTVDKTFADDHHRFDFMVGENQKCGGGTIYKPSPDSAAVFFFINSGLGKEDLKVIEDNLNKIDLAHIQNEKHPERTIASTTITAQTIIDKMKETFESITFEF